MRLDPDAIAASRPDDREIALLADEVRRLQAVIAAEPSPASGGSQPAAWGAVASDGSVVCMMRRRADVASYVVDGTPIVPLYRQPQPTLTDAEREAIEESIKFAFPASHPTATTLRNLLQRTN